MNYYRAVGCSRVFSSTDQELGVCFLLLVLDGCNIAIFWCAAIFPNGCLSETEKSCKVLVRTVY